MINVLVPVTENAEEFLKSVNSICDDIAVQLIVGVTESLAKKYDCNIPNAIVREYEDKVSREEMLNDFQPLLLGEGVFIARKPFTKEEFKNFTSQREQIVVCKSKEKNKIVGLVKRIWRSIVKVIFGVKFFEGDPSLIYFNKELGGVLTNINNFSYSTRIDRWRGTTKTAVDSSYPNVKPQQDKVLNMKLLICAFVALAMGVVTTSLVCIFAKVTVVIGLLLACLDIICLSIFTLLLIAYTFNMQVGHKNINAVKKGE